MIVFAFSRIQVPQTCCSRTCCSQDPNAVCFELLHMKCLQQKKYRAFHLVFLQIVGGY